MADVTLPSLGESVTEGIITQWFKKVGDVVARDEPLFEVSTDKVDSEMPSPAAGVLVEIIAGEGDTVETGSRVAVIDETASASSSSQSAPAAPAPVAEESTVAPTPAPTTAPTPVAATPPAPARPAPSANDDANGVVVSPVVRRILNDGGVEPSTLKGTGPGGSITRRDAERAVAQGPTEEVVLPLSNGRRRMGQHMSVSSQGTPHGFVAVEVDGAIFGALDALGRATRDGEKISDEMVVSLAAVRALAEFEFLNATYSGDELVLHRTVNLGVIRAIADDGMLVPVVHAAAGLTLRALARRVNELDSRVATRQLTADDLMGGTFTIAGAPTEHTLWAKPIIIQPEVAILSMGAVRLVPVVSKDGVSIEAGHRLVLGLSFDHRVCEPTGAASYLERVAELLAGMDLESER
ncbi:MAG TPA: dihydrolipoamide acetyltransferase family protein [Acidimicrobiales bacterium]|nr:dihydrolipoamide acetyltransferase family protein [Acidimicrobiales bacterium]